MRIRSFAFCIIAFSGGALAETVTTTDGRMFELSADGTYRLLTDATASTIQMAEETPYFMHFAGEYEQNSMRFMPIFQNETGKTIVGFKFRADFKSAFGDEVFSFDGESSEKILAGARSTASTYYFFDDNKFMPGQPYDKLQIFEAAGTGTIKTTITAVVFDNGEVIKFDP